MKYKLNGQEINIPLCYDELSYKQMSEIVKLVEAKSQNDIDYICALTDIKKEELLKYDASEYIKITQLFSDWINDIPNFKNIILPSQVLIAGKYHQIPKDIGNLNVECFEVCRISIQQHLAGNITYFELCGEIGKQYFSILHFGKYDPSLASEFDNELNSINWQTVISFGNFFLRKYKELTSGIKKELRNRATHQTRLGRVTKNFHKIGAFFTRSRR